MIPSKKNQKSNPSRSHSSGPSFSKLRKQVRNLDAIFNPSSVAVIGASVEPNKIGNVILRNFLEGGFAGPVYAVNPNHPDVLGVPCLKRASDAAGPVDCALIAVPAPHVRSALQESIRAGARAAVVISGGFSEVGNHDEEMKLKKLADDNDVALIGPNCMGVLNPAARVDSVFLPIYKMGRPHAGPLSFITQSGAVGGCIVDMAARAGMGMSKFVSYGNASVINETDLLQYLAQDKSTGVVVSYLEGVRDGRAFMQAGCAFTSQKPLVILKAGKTSLGAQAAASHTAALAGSYEVYSSAFEQMGAVEAQSLDELFDLSKIFALPRGGGPRIGVVTNGGGNGVLAADAVSDEGLSLASYSDLTQKGLAAMLPPTANLRNPLDLIGDADAARYEKALHLLTADAGVDALVVIVLFQTASLDSSVVNVLVKASHAGKPLVVVSTGGEYTEMHRRILDSSGIPTYSSPNTAVRALAHFLHYNQVWCRYHPGQKMCGCRSV